MIPRNPSRYLRTVVLLAFGAGPPLRAQFHEGDIAVGRTATGQLKVRNVPLAPPYVLSPVNGPLFGFTDNDPGFDHIEIAEPENNFLPLESGAQIKLRMVAVDPAFRVWSSNFSTVLDAPGEEFVLGNYQIHYHATWHIDSTAIGYDPEREHWQATFVLIDTGTTGYAQSAPFTARFANRAPPIPTVSEWGVAVMLLGLMSLGTMLLRARGHTCLPGYAFD